jgi:hypothetical protein
MLRIPLIEIVDLAAICIIELVQQAAHWLVRTISGNEYFFSPAEFLRILYQQGCDTLTSPSGNSVNHSYEAEVEERVFHHDVTGYFPPPPYKVTVSSLDSVSQPLAQINIMRWLVTT